MSQFRINFNTLKNQKIKKSKNQNKNPLKKRPRPFLTKQIYPTNVIIDIHRVIFYLRQH